MNFSFISHLTSVILPFLFFLLLLLVLPSTYFFFSSLDFFSFRIKICIFLKFFVIGMLFFVGFVWLFLTFSNQRYFYYCFGGFDYLWDVLHLQPEKEEKYFYICPFVMASSRLRIFIFILISSKGFHWNLFIFFIFNLILFLISFTWFKNIFL